MKLYDVQSRLTEVFKRMGAQRVLITDFREVEDKKTFVSVLIVFNGFQGIRTLNRVKIANNFILDKASDLVEDGIFAFECFTQEEYETSMSRKNIHL